MPPLPSVESKREGYRESTPTASFLEDKLLLYPTITKGMRTPFDLWRYYGRGDSSFSSPIMPMRFEQWLEFHAQAETRLMRDVHAYMAERYDFSGEGDGRSDDVGGKAYHAWARSLGWKTISSLLKQLTALSAAEIRRRDLFPYKPLAHPLQSVAHMVFPSPGWRCIPSIDASTWIWIFRKATYRSFRRRCF